MTALKVLFEPPKHGWLPVHVSSGEASVKFVASDVPNDPVQELISALDLALRDEEASVWWHLEPDGYYFEFFADASGVRLQISFAPNSERSKKEGVLIVSGTKHEVLLPIWRALRRLESFNAREPHWPSVEFSQLQPIGKALRAEA